MMTTYQSQGCGVYQVLPTRGAVHVYDCTTPTEAANAAAYLSAEHCRDCMRLFQPTEAQRQYCANACGHE